MNRLDKTAADYIAIAVGPALIMMMVGSLVYFLLEVLYQGDYEDRLRWILSCFVFAAVLIGRISIESGTARATLFALPLAISVGLAISIYVQHTGPLASIGLYLDWAILGVIWWCANKLTWDCTFIDEQQADTGEGLLQTIGLDDEAKAADATPAAVAERIAAQEALAQKRRLEGTTGDEEQLPKRWWERWLEGDQRPHSPGVWVVYFSLAALPIFGIGQLFIPAASEDRRQYVFRLLAIYVAAGLGLLLTTSFLGMRRYLRQRYVEMPPLVAKKWIAIGCGLGLGLLVLAMLLPRPNAEYAVSSLTGTIGSPQRQPSRYAPPVGSGANDPDKQARSTTTKGKGPRKKGTGGATKSDGGGPSSKTGDGGSSGKTSGGEPSGKTGGSPPSPDNGAAKTSTDLSPGKEPSSGKQPPDGGAKSQTGNEGSKSPSKSEGSKTPDGSQSGKTSASTDAKSPNGKSPSSETKTEATPPNGEQSKSDDNPDGSDEASEGKSDQGGEQNRSDSSSSSGSSSPSSNFRPLESLSTAVSWLPSLFKWILQAAVIAVVAYLVWRHRKELWAALVALWADLRNLLAGLFGGKKKERPAVQASPLAPSGPQGRPFADYPNPYTTGLLSRLSADQLVAYTFEALEAWAREHGCPRAADQTPLEFAAELASASAPLAEPVRLLAMLYCQVAYAPGTLRPERTGELEYLWRLLSRGSPGERSRRQAEH